PADRLRDRPHVEAGDRNVRAERIAVHEICGESSASPVAVRLRPPERVREYRGVTRRRNLGERGSVAAGLHLEHAAGKRDVRLERVVDGTDAHATDDVEHEFSAGGA